MKNIVNWFELPSTDFDRAVKFYSTILDIEMPTREFNGVPNGFFPYVGEGATGAVVHSPDYTPRADGPVVYLNGESLARMDAILNRIPQAGGQVLLTKTDIGEPGHIALFLDSERNRVGLFVSRS
ncbi:MAG: VOC family protein [Chloroflexota bacterium]